MRRCCPVCGGDSQRTLHQVQYALFDDSTLPRQTTIDGCATCGFVYANANAGPDDYEQHYRRSIYMQTDMRGGVGTSPWDRARLDAAAGRFADRLTEGGLFVDIGAGSGGLLQALRALAPRASCVAVDPDPNCVAGLRAAGWLAEQGTLGALPTSLRGRAKVVALSHVLEHLWDPAGDLERAAELLDDDGVLYVETPDRCRYYAHANVPYYYFDPEHINHFALGDFARLAGLLGLVMQAGGQDRIYLNRELQYPVIWGLLGRASCGDRGQQAMGHCCEDTDLGRYLAQQARAITSWREAFRARLACAVKPWIVWGVGSQAQRVLAENLVDHAFVVAFVDGDATKQRRRLLGREVLAPEVALERYPTATVLVLAARAAEAAIIDRLNREWPRRAVLGLGESVTDQAL